MMALIVLLLLQPYDPPVIRVVSRRGELVATPAAISPNMYPNATLVY